MTPSATRRRLLAAYPRAWRDRYGEELLWLLDDEHDGRLPVSAATGLVASGLVERARRLFDADGVPSAGEPGLRLLAWGWCCCVVGGIGFAKVAEDFSSWRFVARDVPGGHASATATFGVVTWSAAIAAVAVAALMVPALLVAATRASPSGRPALRRRAAVAIGAIVGAAAAIAALAVWAHTLAPAARNGASAAYSVAAIGAACVLTGALAAVTRTVTVALGLVRVAHHRLAVGWTSWTAACCVVTIAGGAAAWWVAMARGAPGFLGPTGPGVGAFDTAWPTLAACQSLLVAGAVLALLGAKATFREQRSEVVASAH